MDNYERMNMIWTTTSYLVSGINNFSGIHKDSPRCAEIVRRIMEDGQAYFQKFEVVKGNVDEERKVTNQFDDAMDEEIRLYWEEKFKQPVLVS
jgi:hypothetical protein|tara:strand:- start:432 stop:710 length:279 start_codon:yes stop_codon:yes gene_type:complete